MKLLLISLLCLAGCRKMNLEVVKERNYDFGKDEYDPDFLVDASVLPLIHRESGSNSDTINWIILRSDTTGRSLFEASK